MQTIILDSTQITAFYACPQMWKYQYDDHISLTGELSEAIVAGSMMHKMLEIYYTMRDTDKIQAVRSAIGFNPDLEPDPTQYPRTQELRDRCTKRFTDYIINYSQHDFEISTIPKPTIAIVDGLPVDVVIQEPLIEKGFSYKLYEDSQYLFILEGRIDLIGSTNGTHFWSDHKTQMTRSELLTSSVQFKNYSLATGLNLGIINYIRMAQKIDQNTFQRVAVSFSSLDMRHWRLELIELYKHVALAKQSNHYFMNRDSCLNKYRSTCQYLQLCEEYNPQTKLALINLDYKVVPAWKPW